MNTFVSSELQSAVALLDLVDGRHDYLAGSRAVEVHVGAAALRSARETRGAEHVADIDLSVSKLEYKHLKQQKQLGAKVIQHRYPRLQREGIYRVNSLQLMDGVYDVWRDRWYEPARYPEGIISVDELAANSVWNEELGLYVLQPDYLVAQRERSVTFLEAKDELTLTEEQRLKKDYADLSALSAA
jgi:hypothetical protein